MRVYRTFPPVAPYSFEAAHKPSEPEDRTINQTLGVSPAKPEGFLLEL
jgi:hypothetical protein